MSAAIRTMLPNVVEAPYWWDAAPPQPLEIVALPHTADAVVIGSGYTGLRAALTLAEAGRSVVVVDREVSGYGASRRNAGFLGRVLKKSFSSLIESSGLDAAKAIYTELNEAYFGTLRFIEERGITCHAKRPGRFIGATSAPHYLAMETELALMERHLGLPFRMVRKGDERSEMATDVYHGGAVIPDLGSLHPGLYHLGLQDLALRAGVTLSCPTEVSRIARTSDGLAVETSRGTVSCGDVLVATNGYTTRSLPWHARRVLPFTGYMAATEELPEDVFARQLPHGRVMIDSNTNIDFFRPAPDSRRILFGGATASGIDGTGPIATKLHAIMSRVLPELAGFRLGHVWSGYCAGTFDMMPHLGGRDRVWYAMGYNFAGVTMGSHMGRKIALQMLGEPEGRSAFESERFPTMPFYDGRSWFMPYVMKYFDWHDARIARDRKPKRPTWF